jgi:hypothetical protein
MNLSQILLSSTLEAPWPLGGSFFFKKLLLIWLFSELMCILINFIDPEVNDYTNF